MFSQKPSLYAGQPTVFGKQLSSVIRYISYLHKINFHGMKLQQQQQQQKILFAEIRGYFIVLDGKNRFALFFAIMQLYI